MEVFEFHNAKYFVTGKLENLAQAKASCFQKAGMIAKFSELNFNKFAEELLKSEVFKLQNSTLRVNPLNSSSENCYGVIDVSRIDVSKGLVGNVVDKCDMYAEYKTLCFKGDDCMSACANVLPSYLLYILVPLILLIGAALGAFGLFLYYKKKRSNKSLTDIELEEV